MKVYHFDTFDTEKVRVLSQLFDFLPIALYARAHLFTFCWFFQHLLSTFALYHTTNTKKAY